jgi:hypothetical protein
MYEASEVTTLGAANELILGSKPFVLELIDNELKEDHMERQQDDIDEDE